MRDDDLIKSRVSAREEKTNLVPKTMILVNDVMKDNSSLTEKHTIDSSPDTFVVDCIRAPLNGTSHS